MTDWICPSDRGRLVRTGDALECETCAARYPLFAEIPDLSTADSGAKRSDPQIEQLWDLVQQHPTEEAARRFCEAHGLERYQSCADWRILTPTTSNGRIVQIGPGFGDDALDLADEIGDAVWIVRDRTNARILRRRLEERALDRSWSIAVMDDLTRLPVTDRSIETVAIEEAAAPAFGVSSRKLPAIAAEWSRILRPGGTLFVGMRNPLTRIPGLGSIVSAIRPKGGPESLNQALKGSSGGGGSSGMKLGRTVRALARAGFGTPTTYAPLPDEANPRIVIPIKDPQVVRYFLNNMLRRNSVMIRGAIGGANLLARLGLLHLFVPYYYLVFKKLR